jgi:plasmid replication initiation protein
MGAARRLIGQFISNIPTSPGQSRYSVCDRRELLRSPRLRTLHSTTADDRSQVEGSMIGHSVCDGRTKVQVSSVIGALSRWTYLLNMFHVSNLRFTEADVSDVIGGKKAKTASRTRRATVPAKRPNIDYQLPLLDSPLQSGVQSDRKFLAFPFFDLSKTPRRKNLKYQEATGDESIVVEVKAVDGNGIATIYDRDMLLYIASLLQQRVKTNPEIANDHKNRENRTFTFTLSDFCEATSRSRGSGYDRVEDIVERLRTTSIRTTIRTSGERTRGWFNWLSEGTYVKSREDSDEGGTFVCVVLCEWLHKAILQDGDMLAIPDTYFYLGPIERRLYDLAHVQCIQGTPWHTTIGTLHGKTGSDMAVRQFKSYLQKVGTTGLPEYEFVILDEYETTDRRTAGRPSVANQKVIVRTRTTPFILEMKASRKGKAPRKSSQARSLTQDAQTGVTPLFDCIDRCPERGEISNDVESEKPAG